MNEFEKKVISLIPKMKFWALSYYQNEEDRNDLIQETVCKILSNPNSYHEMPGKKFEFFLSVVMRNTFINSYRRSRLVRFESLDSVKESGEKTSVYSEMEIKDLKSQIERLPEVYKHPIELTLLGFEYHEICEILNIKMGTVKSRIHFGKKILIKRLVA